MVDAPKEKSGKYREIDELDYIELQCFVRLIKRS
jgi:hypothetical protein